MLFILLFLCEALCYITIQNPLLMLKRKEELFTKDKSIINGFFKKINLHSWNDHHSMKFY